MIETLLRIMKSAIHVALKSVILCVTIVNMCVCVADNCTKIERYIYLLRKFRLKRHFRWNSRNIFKHI